MSVRGENLAIEPKVGPPSSVREKIKSLPQLAKELSAARALEKKIVHAHGVFDLIHVGHIRHLEAARREGQILVVTITADKYVNKGPGRPVFTEELRAEMLASLFYVDFVAINDAPTAENALQLIRPDVYVKGSDYRQAETDVTGKILAERAIVESYGGRVIITEEITYSSSTLINQNFGIYDHELGNYLDTLRSQGSLATLIDYLDQIADLKILVVGDTIIDEYQYVEALGKPSKETMVATRFLDREVFAGGVIAAANHIAGFCQQVDVVTALGSVDSYSDVVRESLRPNINFRHIVRKNAPTTRKTRFVDMGYSMRKLFEVYVMDDSLLPSDTEEQFATMLAENLNSYDVVIVTDFGHGLISDATVSLLNREARFLAVNCQTNSGNHGYNLITKYPRADYVCIDGNEARLACHDKYSGLEEILSNQLPNIIECDRMIVTQGKHGCLTLDHPGRLNHVPTFTSSIIDTVGAGDAFFALSAPIAALGAPMPIVGFMGNVAGAMKVGIVGHRTSVEKVPYIKFITALLK